MSALHPALAKRKRTINLITFALYVPMFAMLECMRRGLFLPPLHWALLAGALLVGHAVWVVYMCSCPFCTGMMRGIFTKDACSQCGRAFRVES